MYTTGGTEYKLVLLEPGNNVFCFCEPVGLADPAIFRREHLGVSRRLGDGWRRDNSLERLRSEVLWADCRRVRCTRSISTNLAIPSELVSSPRQQPTLSFALQRSDAYAGYFGYGSK